MRAKFGRLESEHDVRLGNAGLLEFACDTVLGAITLDPAFAIDEVDMNEAPVDTAAVPAKVHEEIMVTLPVKNGLRLDFTVRRGEPGVIIEKALDGLAINV
jgi:hypothetical protein